MRTVDEAFQAWPGGQRDAIATARRAGGLVAGRYLHGVTRDLLEDESGVIEVPAAAPRPPHGSQVMGRLEPDERGGRLREVRILTPATGALPPELLRLAALRPVLRQRAAIVAAIREVLGGRGFLEVETPARVVNPGLEVHLRPFRSPSSAADERYLITSPELHLKRLLAAGYERIFELARCWRDEEMGALHLPEFLMLEWYRAHAGLDALAGDIAELLPRCAESAGVHPARAVAHCDLSREPERVKFADAFERHAGQSPEGLAPDERERLFVEKVEPKLGRGRPTLLWGWPEDAAALARLVTDERGRRVAARMELYVAGVELANGFDELTDPAEQRRRHEEDRRIRQEAGTLAPPLDEGFLAALEAGMPPSAGMALGVDRLVMLITRQARVADVRAFAT